MRRLCVVALAASCGGSPAPRPVEAPPPTPTSNVEIADDALPLVDAWAEALGGPDAIAKLGTIHTKGDCTISGRTCTFESFLSPKGELRYEATFQDGAVLHVFDGTTAWRKEGGVVTEISGTELSTILHPSFLESYSVFFSDRQHGSVTREGTSSLTIVPRGAMTPMTVRFRTDHLPVSGESPDFRVVYKGWNEYMSVQIPQSWTSGPTGTEDTFRLSSIDDQQGSYTKP